MAPIALLNHYLLTGKVRNLSLSGTCTSIVSDREAKRVERERRKRANEAYEGLTKAELSDQLAGWGLPKTGNIDELIERLVSADSE